MLKVKWTGAEDYGRHIKVVFAGVGGSGKTLVSSGFPNPLYASAEAGLMSVAKLNVPYVEIDSTRTLLEMKNALDQTPEVREKTFGFPVDTLVVDTFDEIQRLLIHERCLSENRKDGMQQNDWGWLLERQQAMVRGLRNLPMNVVLTVHIKQKSDQETGAVWFEPALQGAFADQLNEYVDVMAVLRSEAKTVVDGNRTRQVQERSIQFSPTSKYPFLKDRSGTLPNSIPIDFSTEYARINELVFADIGSMAPRKEISVETEPEPILLPVTQEEPKPEPVKAPVKKSAAPVKSVAKKSVAPTPAKKAAALPSAAAKPETVERPSYLPDGVEPKPISGAVGFYCVECGNELESMDQKNISRIRYREPLCREHFEARGAK